MTDAPARRQKVWHDLVAVADLEKGDVTPVSLGARELAVYDGLDGITVSHARCTHGAANLCDGYFDGRRIECPLHQGLFDARTGAVLAAPARLPLRMIEARVERGMVQVLI
ncbi:Rieske 2Fe-2S domain-containing protein [Albidovulum sp.]|uniref:Rieske 2Fe-2S domain-containing protein n=1 Tax=Albidovulum sp. TaxID=1872424 RepID=UPI002C0B2836|nr:Rieske 2Fe-2S domain-containing protein [Paracoccaceae bacterium]MCP5376244.1 Rieske 2Fe-2S domain-containing protein [Paracoccaceae bacterium]HRV62479.1 Rieske 2Fe-2S domain-containing protein [Albidovulum sp.]